MLNKQKIHCLGARVQIVCKGASQEDEESLVEKIRLCRITQTFLEQRDHVPNQCTFCYL